MIVHNNSVNYLDSHHSVYTVEGSNKVLMLWKALLFSQATGMGSILLRSKVCFM